MTVRYQFTPTSIINIKKTDHIKCCQRYGAIGTPIMSSENVNW